MEGRPRLTAEIGLRANPVEHTHGRSDDSFVSAFRGDLGIF